MLLCVAIVIHLGFKNVDYMGGEFASQHVRATVAVAIGELPSKQRLIDFASSRVASHRFKQGHLRKKGKLTSKAGGITSLLSVSLNSSESFGKCLR